MDALLKCEVSRGQFDNEASVKFADFSGEDLSLFAPLRDVQPSNGLCDDWIAGTLRVEILDRKEGFSLVYLPSPTFSSGQTITVEDRQLIFHDAPCNLQVSQ